MSDKSQTEWTEKPAYALSPKEVSRTLTSYALVASEACGLLTASECAARALMTVEEWEQYRNNALDHLQTDPFSKAQYCDLCDEHLPDKYSGVGVELPGDPKERLRWVKLPHGDRHLCQRCLVNAGLVLDGLSRKSEEEA